jgi:hypothetical protein
LRWNGKSGTDPTGCGSGTPAEQTGFAVSRQHFPSILNALERGETLVEVV